MGHEARRRSAPDEISTARARAPRAWAVFDEVERLMFTAALPLPGYRELEGFALALSQCGRGRYGDISPEAARDIRARLAAIGRTK